MNDQKLKIKILDPDKVVFDGEADSLFYPVEGGERMVLPGHTRLIAPLSLGEIRLKKEGREERFAVKTGLIKIDHTRLDLLVS
jgi:F-type H+-transporting ATPase subunit epsilon